MAGKRFNTEKLAQLLAPKGFVLNFPEAMKSGISFVRASSADRLYEHVLIHADNPVFAETAISAAPFSSCSAYVSERDKRFRRFLAGDSQFQSSRILTPAEAKAWQKRLVENADAYSMSTLAAKGPVLLQRLQPVFSAIDSYVNRLGDLFAIFDREFAFVTEGPSDEQTESDRLATFARRMLYLNSEDAKIASLALVRFGVEVEGRDVPFRGIPPHRDAGLAARLILMADFIRLKRLEYATAGGLCR